MSAQPEALRLADALDELDAQFSFPGMCGEAAAELRRQHAEIEQLRDALEAAAQPSAAGKDDSLRSDALRTLSFCAGLKAGWNFCVSGDDAGFERAKSQSSEALRVLRAERKSPAAEQEPVAFKQFLSNVLTAAGLLEHGKQSKALAKRIADAAVLYMTAAPQPAHQPLTDERIDSMVATASLAERDMFRRFARAIERAHGIGGEA